VKQVAASPVSDMLHRNIFDAASNAASPAMERRE
jgi:hypothetical protein